MMRPIFSAAPALAFFFAACGADTTIVDHTKRPAKSRDATIELYFNQPPQRPYQIIATSRVVGDEMQWQRDLEDLKAQARKLGGDALIVRGGNSVITPGQFHNVTVKEGIIIAWK